MSKALFEVRALDFDGYLKRIILCEGVVFKHPWCLATTWETEARPLDMATKLSPDTDICLLGRGGGEQISSSQESLS